MSESSDPRQRAKSAFQGAKKAVGIGDPPLATEVGGRVEAVRDALRAFGEGDHDRFLSALGDNVDWVGPRGENFPGAGSCEGRDAVKERFVGGVERSYTEFGFTPERYLESTEENLVVVVGAFGGQGVKGPSQFDAPGVQIWEFDGDKVVGVQIFADSDAFPEAVDEDEPEPGEEDEEQDSDGEDGESEGGARAEQQDSGGADGESEGGESEAGARAEKQESGHQDGEKGESGDGQSGEESDSDQRTETSKT